MQALRILPFPPYAFFLLFPFPLSKLSATDYLRHAMDLMPHLFRTGLAIKRNKGHAKKVKVENVLDPSPN